MKTRRATRPNPPPSSYPTSLPATTGTGVSRDSRACRRSCHTVLVDRGSDHRLGDAAFDAPLLPRSSFDSREYTIRCARSSHPLRPSPRCQLPVDHLCGDPILGRRAETRRQAVDAGPGRIKFDPIANAPRLPRVVEMAPGMLPQWHSQQHGRIGRQKRPGAAFRHASSVVAQTLHRLSSRREKCSPSQNSAFALQAQRRHLKTSASKAIFGREALGSVALDYSVRFVL